MPAAPVGLRDCIDGKPLLHAEVAGSLDEPLLSNPKHIRVPAHLLLLGPVEAYRDDPVAPILQRCPGRRVPFLLRRVQVVAAVNEDAGPGHAFPLVVEVGLAGHIWGGTVLGVAGKPVAALVAAHSLNAGQRKSWWQFWG